MAGPKNVKDTKVIQKLITARFPLMAAILFALLSPALIGCGGGNTAEQEKTPEQQLEEEKGRNQRELEEVRGS